MVIIINGSLYARQTSTKYWLKVLFRFAGLFTFEVVSHSGWVDALKSPLNITSEGVEFWFDKR